MDKHDIVKQARILERIAHYIAIQEIEPTEEILELMLKFNEKTLNQIRYDKAQDEEER